MTFLDAKLASALIVAVVLSCIAAWIIAHRYRRAMQRFMRAPMAAAPPPTVPVALVPPPLAAALTLADNRRAGIRLTLVLIGLSCLLAATSASLWMLLAFPDEPFRPKRAATVALLHAWPVIPALALMWRWSRARLFGVLALWCVVCFGVFLWRSIEIRPLQTLVALASEIAPALLIVSMLLLGNATRAITPWLLLPFFGLVWASFIGMDVLWVLVERQSVLIKWVVMWLPVPAAMGLFALVPWLVAWWPLRRFARALGHAYSRKWLSDLMVVFTTVWAIALTEKALIAASSAGFAALALFLPLLWIPLFMWVNGKLQHHSGPPPTLLVLRVFQHDAQVQDLFDHVIERWRLSGNTVMIAGTDLADRTLGADDIFAFLDGKLAQRFIHTPADVGPRIAGFDMAPDLDGRYRVNECYCHDTTWQQALQALVERSNVVLMDLRGFKAHNAGCRFELGTLSQAARHLHVVVLTDGATDRAAAEEAIAGGRAERFVWLDVTCVDARMRREVLARLFDYQPVSHPPHNVALSATG